MAFARAYLFGEGTSTEEVKKKLAAANPGSLVQVARAGTAGSEVLVEMLAAQTFSAEASGRLLANKAEIDLLLRLAGTTQISKAIEGYGATPGEGFLAINASRTRLRVPSGFGEVELPRRALTEVDLSRIERAALLNLQKGQGAPRPPS